MDMNYNTVAGIQASLESLNTFTKLLDARRVAREQNLPLRIFVVQGKWYLDQFAQIGYLTLQDQKFQPLSPDSLFLTEMDEVMSIKSFEALRQKHQLNYSIMLNGKGPLPKPTSYCAHCGARWHIDNLDDYRIQSDTIPAVELMKHVGYHIAEDLIKYLVKESKEGRVDRDDKNDLAEQFLEERTGHQWAIHSDNGKVSYYTFTKYFHNKCHDEIIRQENFKAFKHAIEQAGFKVHGMIRTKNEYGSKDYRGDWLLVDMEYGLLRVGWRKRVINIDYSGIDPDYLPVTEETSGPGYEHVYGYEQLSKALAAFRIYIQSKKNFEVNIPHLVFGAKD